MVITVALSKNKQKVCSYPTDREWCVLDNMEWKFYSSEALDLLWFIHWFNKDWLTNLVDEKSVWTISSL